MDEAKIKADLAAARKEQRLLTAYIAAMEGLLGIDGGSEPAAQQSFSEYAKRRRGRGETRRAVLRVLADGGDWSAKDVATKIGVSANSASHVLRTERDKGTIEMVRFGIYRRNAPKGRGAPLAPATAPNGARREREDDDAPANETALATLDEVGEAGQAR